MRKIEAKIIADSIGPNKQRITSMILTYPRFIHSEVMTHRMFSRNSASSRAIPFEKMVKMVEEDPFIPIAWQKDHKGMQGTEYLTDIMDIERAEHRWRMSIANNIDQAKVLNDGIGVTKQLCNRLLEPFMWHTVLVTATEWDNFFKLRCPNYHLYGGNFKSKKEFLNSSNRFAKEFEDVEFNAEFFRNNNTSQAEIHIQALAEAMWDAYHESTPKNLEEGEWHIPFNLDGDETSRHALTETGRIKIATARCARLSYMTFEGKIDYEKDIALHDQLLTNGHMSPFEHCARAMSDYEFNSYQRKYPTPENVGVMSYFPKDYGWCANFKGFISYRYLIEKENEQKRSN